MSVRYLSNERPSKEIMVASVGSLPSRLLAKKMPDSNDKATANIIKEINLSYTFSKTANQINGPLEIQMQMSQSLWNERINRFEKL